MIQDKPTLILTLAIETQGFHLFNALRQKYFPPNRNFIDAHLTLFHLLPNEESIYHTVREICSPQRCFMLTIKEPITIGNGVGFPVESPELMQLHGLFASRWSDFLSPQDRQKFWPHITVQNKVPSEEAKKTLQELRQSFNPHTMLATGLQLWEYLHGPWRAAEQFVFMK